MSGEYINRINNQINDRRQVRPDEIRLFCLYPILYTHSTFVIQWRGMIGAGGGARAPPPKISKIGWTFLDPFFLPRSITCRCPPPPPQTSNSGYVPGGGGGVWFESHINRYHNISFIHILYIGIKTPTDFTELHADECDAEAEKVYICWYIKCPDKTLTISASQRGCCTSSVYRISNINFHFVIILVCICLDIHACNSNHGIYIKPRIYWGLDELNVPLTPVSSTSLLDRVICITLHSDARSSILLFVHRWDIRFKSLWSTLQSFGFWIGRYSTVSSAYCGSEEDNMEGRSETRN